MTTPPIDVDAVAALYRSQIPNLFYLERPNMVALLDDRDRLKREVTSCVAALKECVASLGVGHQIAAERDALKREVAELREVNAELETLRKAACSDLANLAMAGYQRRAELATQRDRLLSLLKLVMADPACQVPRTWCKRCASSTPIVKPGSPDSRCCSVCGGDLAEIGGEVSDV